MRREKTSQIKHVELIWAKTTKWLIRSLITSQQAWTENKAKSANTVVSLGIFRCFLDFFGKLLKGLLKPTAKDGIQTSKVFCGVLGKKLVKWPCCRYGRVCYKQMNAEWCVAGLQNDAVQSRKKVNRDFSVSYGSVTLAWWRPCITYLRRGAFSHPKTIFKRRISFSVQKKKGVGFCARFPHSLLSTRNQWDTLKYIYRYIRSVTLFFRFCGICHCVFFFFPKERKKKENAEGR